MSYLSVCAIVKNEFSYIDEWLEFNLLQGVEHFYIYENGSTDGTIGKLINYPDLITIIPWSDSPGQFTAYNHAIKAFRESTKWMAFLDVDEFLYSPLKRRVSDLLKKFENYGAVAAHWIIYGSNGHEVKTDGLVIERFIKRHDEVNHHVKCIVQLAKAKSVGKNPHYFSLNDGEVAVNEYRNKLTEPYGIVEKGSAAIFRVNHYHLKSREEYFERKKLGDPGSGVVHPPERVNVMFDAHDKNERSDFSACRYIEEIKENIRKRKEL